jgi:hypothetical protein
VVSPEGELSFVYEFPWYAEASPQPDGCFESAETVFPAGTVLLLPVAPVSAWAAPAMQRMATVAKKADRIAKFPGTEVLAMAFLSYGSVNQITETK